MTLRSGFQSGDTGERHNFPGDLFYWLATRGHAVACRSEPTGVVVFSGSCGSEPRLRSSRCSCIPGCTPVPLPSPPPLRSPPHPRDPLISGLRGSRNEPSEARWHEEGSVGWVVGGAVQNYAIAASQPFMPPLCVDLPVVIPRGNQARQQPSVFVKDIDVASAPYFKTSSSMAVHSARLTDVLKVPDIRPPCKDNFLPRFHLLFFLHIRYLI